VISVAVIIVTYKTAQLTIDCLHSISAERDANTVQITVTVVDNSTEDFSSIQQAIELNRWSDWVEVVCPPKNGGFAYGNNFGVKIAYSRRSPDYIHFLNPDTVVRKGAIRTLVDFLETNPAAGIAGSSFENLDGTDWPFAFRFPTMVSEIEGGLGLGLVTKLLHRWVVAKKMGKSPEQTDWVPGASMMVRRSTFDVTGGLDEAYFLYFEETDFCFRAKKHGLQTWYIPDSRVMHIAGQSTKVTERNAENRRLPSYWFESRRRFFMKSYGVPYAILTDIVAIAAYFLGKVKRLLLRQSEREIPCFISDLVRYGAFWPKKAVSKR